MSTLTERHRQILLGETDLPDWKRRRYYWSLSKRHVIPEELRPPGAVDLPPPPPSPSRTEAPAIPSITEAEAFERFPCRYRNPTSEVVECKVCRDERTHTVCHCSLFDRECTVRAGSDKLRPTRRFLMCAGCDARAPAPRHMIARGTFRWACGMTTAPRPVPTLSRSIDSLRTAGFGPFHLFAEPGTTLANLPADTTVHRRPQRLGVWQNLVQSLRDLLALHPEADTIALFQDDVVSLRDVREWLEHDLWPSPRTGCVSIYSPDWHGYEAAGVEAVRRIRGTQIMGACGLIFPRHAVERILAHPLSTTWRGCYDKNQFVENPVHRKASDTFVGHVLSELGLEKFAYSPSLLQHFADTSAIGHPHPSQRLDGKYYRKSVLFAGEDRSAFDVFASFKLLARWQLTTPDGRHRPHLRWADRPQSALPLLRPISIVIPGHNAPELTIRCLEAIARQEVETEVIYVDNGSSPENLQAIEAVGCGLWAAGGAKGSFRVLRNDANLGYTGATNQGIRAATPGNHVLLLNNDCFLGRGCLAKLRFHLEQHWRVAAVGPVTGDRGAQSVIHEKVRTPGHLPAAIVGIKDNPDAAAAVCARVHRIANVETLSGFCLLMHGDAVRELGPLSEDPGYQQGLGTDDEWTRRARKAKWQVLVCYSAFAAHVHSATFRELNIDRRAAQVIAGKTLHRGDA
jgi:GT2 family glycosyltransferase